jgi:3-deoxy-D-manno-octulosonic-acid transferase
MENFREMSGNFLAAGAAIQVKSSGDLGAAWVGLLRDQDRAGRMGTCARELVDGNRGATDRVLKHIENVIGSERVAG